MTKYQRYQDYVIKDGRLVGEFEQMYQDFEDPWEQTTREQMALEKWMAVELVRRNKCRRVLELGCGLGEFTARLGEVSPAVLGVDISETAIKKARIKYPDINFEVADLLNEEVYQRFRPDCIIMAEITWYVLDLLSAFKRLLSHNFGGRSVSFIHLLMTYPEGEQKYGREYFTNLTEIMNYWDCVEFHQWGVVGCQDYRGGYRTFCCGTIK